MDKGNFQILIDGGKEEGNVISFDKESDARVEYGTLRQANQFEETIELVSVRVTKKRLAACKNKQVDFGPRGQQRKKGEKGKEKAATPPKK